MLPNLEITLILGIEKVPDLLVVNLIKQRSAKLRMQEQTAEQTSIYDTSTVNCRFGSAACLASVRKKSSEHVRGMIPLSAPSEGSVRKVTTIKCFIHTAHHTISNV